MMRRFLSLAIHALLFSSEGVWGVGLGSSSAAEIGEGDLQDPLADPSLESGDPTETVPVPAGSPPAEPSLETSEGPTETLPAGYPPPAPAAPFPDPEMGRMGREQEAWLRTVRDQLREGGVAAEEAGLRLAEFCTATRRSFSSTKTVNRDLVAFLLGKFVFYLPPMPRHGQNTEDLRVLLRTGELMIPSWFLGPYAAGLDGHVRAARAALHGLSVLIAGDEESSASSSPAAVTWGDTRGEKSPAAITEDALTGDIGRTGVLRAGREGGEVAADTAPIVAGGCATQWRWRLSKPLHGGACPTGMQEWKRAARAAVQDLVVLIRGGGGGGAAGRYYREAVAEELADLVGGMAQQARGRDDVVDSIYYLGSGTFHFLSETTGYTWRMPDSLAEALRRG